MNVVYNLQPYDINLLKSQETTRRPKKYIKNDIIKLLDEFIDRGYECCLICTCVDNDQAHVKATIIRRTILIQGYHNIKVIRRKTKVYIVKKNKWEG